MKQNINGKAFEYTLAIAFYQITKAKIQENSLFEVAKNCYRSLEDLHKYILEKASSEAAMFLQAHDARVTNARSILLQDDGVGIQGDVRDIVIEVPKGQIGISAKYNHAAIKHSRLSDKIYFGKEWTDHPCGEKYFKTIQPVFMQLNACSEYAI
ncbi:HaeIII family restriction endonuclease [Wolbachia pipientis]|nr:HaeIII family restriction endonuclease [Wolbachia pipientis]